MRLCGCVDVAGAQRDAVGKIFCEEECFPSRGEESDARRRGGAERARRRAFWVVTSAVSRNFSLRFLDLLLYTWVNDRRWRKCEWGRCAQLWCESGRAAARVPWAAYFAGNIARVGASARAGDNAWRGSSCSLCNTCFGPTPEGSFSVGTRGEIDFR